jgi:hypothetical protein
MKKILLMTKVSLDNLWTDTHSKANTQGRNVDTVEKAIAIIDIIYKDSLAIHDYIINETEIWAICENNVSPCINCQNNL